jgi:hypothetical protein
MSKIIIHNAETNEIIEREMNDKELQDYNAREAEAQAQKEIEAQKAADRAALLAKLGINEAEARLLLG